MLNAASNTFVSYESWYTKCILSTIVYRMFYVIGRRSTPSMFSYLLKVYLLNVWIFWFRCHSNPLPDTKNLYQRNFYIPSNICQLVTWVKVRVKLEVVSKPFLWRNQRADHVSVLSNDICSESAFALKNLFENLYNVYSNFNV